MGKFAIDNSPSILTAFAVTGAVTTAVLAGRASFEAAQIIALQEGIEGVSGDPKQRLKDRVRLAAPLYIPAISAGVVTVACIIGANQIGNRRAAAMAAAYGLSEKAFTEYRDKVVEKIGEKKERAIVDEVAQDRVNANPPNKEIIILSGDVLCRDDFSGRYFTSSAEKIKAAQNEINHQVLNDYYASLSDFYHKLGLRSTAISDQVGWNCDKMLEIIFSTVLSEDERPCLSVGFRTSPIRDFYRIN